MADTDESCRIGATMLDVDLLPVLERLDWEAREALDTRTANGMMEPHLWRTFLATLCTLKQHKIQ